MTLPVTDMRRYPAGWWLCWMVIIIVLAGASCRDQKPPAQPPSTRLQLPSQEDCDRAKAALDRALVLVGERKYTLAIAELERAVHLNECQSVAHYLLGWIRATCPEPEFRNGPLAVRCAQAAIDTDRYFDSVGVTDRRARWMTSACLAAAYAESGEFEKAVEAQKEALKLVHCVPVEDRGVELQRIVNSRLQAGLRLYEAGKPLRTYEVALSKLSDAWADTVLQANDQAALPEIAE